MLLLHSADRSRMGTPMEGKSFSSAESTSENDPQILWNSNSVSKPLTTYISTLHEIKRKRESRSLPVEDNENSSCVPSSTILAEKKIAPKELNKARKTDAAKTYGRLTRSAKVAVTTQKLFPHCRSRKEQQVEGVRDKDKIRGWAR